MEVQFTPEQQARLRRMAAAQGFEAESLVRQAVDRLLQSEDWFLQEVDKGLAAADAGELVEHEDVRRLLESRYQAGLTPPTSDPRR